MKTIADKIFEAKQDLCPEIQNEFGDDYAYQSFNIKKNKYQYGFLTFNAEQEFYSVTAFNEDSEYAGEFADQYDIAVEDLIDLNIGESISDFSHGSKYAYYITRIW